MIDEHEVRRTDNQFAHLTLVLGFFARAEGKTQFLTGLVVGMLGVLATVIGAAGHISWTLVVFVIIAMALLLATLAKLYEASYPNLKGGEASLIYFNEIAKLREAQFIESIQKVSERDLFVDLAAQTWRNSEILAEKFAAIKRAHGLLIIAVYPWLCAILLPVIVRQFPNLHIP